MRNIDFEIKNGLCMLELGDLQLALTREEVDKLHVCCWAAQMEMDGYDGSIEQVAYDGPLPDCDCGGCEHCISREEGDVPEEERSAPHIDFSDDDLPF